MYANRTYHNIERALGPRGANKYSGMVAERALGGGDSDDRRSMHADSGKDVTAIESHTFFKYRLPATG